MRVLFAPLGAYLSHAMARPAALDLDGVIKTILTGERRAFESALRSMLPTAKRLNPAIVPVAVYARVVRAIKTRFTATYPDADTRKKMDVRPTEVDSQLDRDLKRLVGVSWAPLQSDGVDRYTPAIAAVSDSFHADTGLMALDNKNKGIQSMQDSIKARLAQILAATSGVPVPVSEVTPSSIKTRIPPNAAFAAAAALLQSKLSGMGESTEPASRKEPVRAAKSATFLALADSPNGKLPGMGKAPEVNKPIVLNDPGKHDGAKAALMALLASRVSGVNKPPPQAEPPIAIVVVEGAPPAPPMLAGATKSIRKLVAGAGEYIAGVGAPAAPAFDMSTLETQVALASHAIVQLADEPGVELEQLDEVVDYHVELSAVVDDAMRRLRITGSDSPEENALVSDLVHEITRALVRLKLNQLRVQASGEDDQADALWLALAFASMQT